VVGKFFLHPVAQQVNGSGQGTGWSPLCRCLCRPQ
jgi:hypothetical protein